MPRTMYDKIWDAHSIMERADGSTLLYVDRNFVHDITVTPFDALDKLGAPLRRPDLTFGLADHYVSTGSSISKDRDINRHMVSELARSSRQWGFTSYGEHDPHRGIVHVVGPELGITLPGSLLVCCDSHTSTHGALGSLAFGIGMSEMVHVMATQTIWQRKTKRMLARIDGTPGDWVAAKDIVLALIGKIGAGGASGFTIEYAGDTISALSMEQRMTICNMSIEAGARAGMCAPDDTTIEWLAGRPFAPKGSDWDAAVAYWNAMGSDEDAAFDKVVTLNAEDITPSVTWGTSPENVVSIDGVVPDPADFGDVDQRQSIERAIRYMGLEPGRAIAGVPINRVFIGSCTNGRLEDLRLAAEVAKKGRARIPAFVTPGSAQVKAQAEAEGLDRIFIDAGFEWTKPGCSMCVAVNGDTVPAGERCASTSNRNFEGRQGRGSRTHLLSPSMAAAAALCGELTDVRRL